VKAGLLPVIRKRLPQSIVLGPVRPGARPCADLEVALARADNVLADYLVVDQLEELVTMTADAAERDRFLTQLAAIARRGSKVVITLRADFETSLWRGKLQGVWADARFPMSDMTQDELREAILAPAETTGLQFDPSELVDRMVNWVLGTPGVLPLLSFTLKCLFDDMVKRATGDRKLRETDDVIVGAIPLALQRHADALHRSLDASSRNTLHAIMLRMLGPQGVAWCRRRVALRELDFADSAEAQRVHRVLSLLSAPDLRLVVQGADTAGAIYAEPAHDDVLRWWSSVRSEVADPTAIGDLLSWRAVTAAAFDWADHGRRKQLLWATDARLPPAIKELRRPLRWNAIETAFLEASWRARTKRIRGIAVVVAAVIALLTAAAVYSLQARPPNVLPGTHREGSSIR
jgi:hypothetical protein